MKACENRACIFTKIKIHAFQKIDILRFRLAVLFYHNITPYAIIKTIRQKNVDKKTIKDIINSSLVALMK